MVGLSPSFGRLSRVVLCATVSRSPAQVGVTATSGSDGGGSALLLAEIVRNHHTICDMENDGRDVRLKLISRETASAESVPALRLN